MNKSQNQKWLTCCPKDFDGSARFFSRDSGLLCKGFQEIGIVCKSILPGEPRSNDQIGDLIRTSYDNLEDPNWWRSHNAKGVVLYAWGDGRYHRIANAIKESNMVLVSHIDTGGVFSILNGIRCYVGCTWRTLNGREKNLAKFGARFASRLIGAMTVGLAWRDSRRAMHLRKADVIGAISPIAKERIQSVCRFYGGRRLSERVALIPHPNAPYMVADPEVAKDRLVIAVGRWADAAIKGTDLLMETITKAWENDHEISFEIFGEPTDEMKRWVEDLPNGAREKVILRGNVANKELRRGLQRARISLCTSLQEGYHTVSAEALCCGASIVGPDVPEIPSLKWFTQRESGLLAERNSTKLSQAINREMRSWDIGERDPKKISERWTEKFHAPNVARLILQLVEHGSPT